MKAELKVWISRSQALHECTVTLEGEPEEVIQLTETLMKHYGDDIE